MGLYTWDQLGDSYNYAQLAQNFQTLDFHDHSAGRGTQIPAGGLAPGAVLSSNIAANQIGFQHFAQTAIQNLGLNQPGSNGQGYLSIPTSQSVTSTTYTTLTTPDLISVTIGTGGLIYVAYMATWSSSVANAGNAAIFLGANQVQGIASGTATAPAVQAATSAAAGISAPLATGTAGLYGGAQTANYTGNVTTGQIVSSNLASTVGASGFTTIFAAPGTYNVSIQFKSSSGSVTALNRQLWVWTRNFN